MIPEGTAQNAILTHGIILVAVAVVVGLLELEIAVWNHAHAIVQIALMTTLRIMMVSGSDKILRRARIDEILSAIRMSIIFISISSSGFITVQVSVAQVGQVLMGYLESSVVVFVIDADLVHGEITLAMAGSIVMMSLVSLCLLNA